jgi:hypothetical protein
VKPRRKLALAGTLIGTSLLVGSAMLPRADEEEAHDPQAMCVDQLQVPTQTAQRVS